MKSLILLATLLTTKIAIACPSGQICAGERIIDNLNMVGTVAEVFSNGKAKILSDGQSYYKIKPIGELVKGYECVEKLCVNDRVIDDLDMVATVVEVFSNGKAKILSDGQSYYKIKPIGELVKGYTCIGNICTNDRIIDDADMVGKIVELFSNGKAKVQFDIYSYYSIRTFSKLGIKLNCTLNKNCICTK